tara:strand:+ start:1048 stop:1206 length:159 start_codon:yes stop_codon:yes gene_type:complete
MKVVLVEVVNGDCNDNLIDGGWRMGINQLNDDRNMVTVYFFGCEWLMESGIG